MTLAELVGVLRRLWIVPIVAMAVGLLIAVAIGLDQGTSYRSDVNLLLSVDVNTGDSKDVSNALVALDRRTLVGTLGVVAGSDRIQAAAEDAANVPSGDITGFGGTAVAEANVVTLEVTGTSAASVESVTAKAVDGIVAEFGRQYPLYRVESLDRPKPVVDAGAPWWQLIAAGLVGGGLVGVLVALAVDAAQRSRLDRDPTVPMGYVAVPVEFVQPMQRPDVSPVEGARDPGSGRDAARRTNPVDEDPAAGDRAAEDRADVVVLTDASVALEEIEGVGDDEGGSGVLVASLNGVADTNSGTGRGKQN